MPPSPTVPEILATPATVDMISGIGDTNITGTVNPQAFGRVEWSGRRGPIAVMAGRTRPNVGSYNTGYINLADNIIVGIGNVDIAIFIQRDLMRLINTGGHPCRAIAKIRDGAVTSDRRYELGLADANQQKPSAQSTSTPTIFFVCCIALSGEYVLKNSAKLMIQ